MSAKPRAKPRTRQPERPRRGAWRTAALIAIVIVGALTYANSLAAPFIFDDDAVVVENATIRSSSPLSALLTTPGGGAPTAGRPLANFSFAVNYAIGGLDVRGYHAVNVGVHLICALLLFGIIRRTLARSGEQRPDAVALVCALVWMVHPLQSETVDYISARTESMMALFLLLTLYCSLRAHDAAAPAAWQIGAVVSCVLGTACKESMAAALPLVALYDRIFLFPSWKETMRSRWPLYAGLAASWLELAWLASHGPRGSSAGWSPDPGLVTPVTPWVYLLNQAVMIVHYLRLTFWPGGMVLDYGVPRALTLAQVAPQMVFVTLLGLLTIVALVRAPAAGFLGAWFFVTLAPSSSIVPIHTEVGAERRMYLASMAVVVLIVVAVHRWVGPQSSCLGRRRSLGPRAGRGGGCRRGRARLDDHRPQCGICVGLDDVADGGRSVAQWPGALGAGDAAQGCWTRRRSASVAARGGRRLSRMRIAAWARSSLLRRGMRRPSTSSTHSSACARCMST